jgi:hypothetical protein
VAVASTGAQENSCGVIIRSKRHELECAIENCIMMSSVLLFSLCMIVVIKIKDGVDGQAMLHRRKK